MTLKEIHETLVYQCTNKRAQTPVPDCSPRLKSRMDHFAWIDIPLEATALAITRLIENDLVKPPADFDLERVKQANAYLDHNIAIALIEEALLTEYFAFEVLLSFLALRLSYGNGNTCHCGMDGKLIPNNDRIPRISFNIMEGDAFWFKELCGYRHYPSIPLKWLEKKINLSEWNNYEASIFDELKGSVPDGEFWKYRMSPEDRGPLCDEAGYAIVLDGIPIKTTCSVIS